MLIKAPDALKILRVGREAIRRRMLWELLVGNVRRVCAEAVLVHFEAEVGELIVLDWVGVLKAGQDMVRV